MTPLFRARALWALAALMALALAFPARGAPRSASFEARFVIAPSCWARWDPGSPSPAAGCLHAPDPIISPAAPLRPGERRATIYF